MDTFKLINRYSKSGLWQLYIAVAFPMHLWAVIMILMDLPWIADRSNIGDAIGAAAYGLMFIFFESLIFFSVLLLVGFLLPKNWPKIKRITLLGVLVTVPLVWAILGQMYFIFEITLPPGVIEFLVKSSHPLWIIYGVLLSVVLPTVVFPVFAGIRSERFQQGFISYIDKVSVLMAFYLFLDVASIVIVLIRNIG